MFLLCDSMEGKVCINLDNVAYFRDLNGSSDKVEFFMNCQRDGRIVVEGSTDKLSDLINLHGGDH